MYRSVDIVLGAYHSPHPFLEAGFRGVYAPVAHAMSEFALQVQDIDETGKDYSFPIRSAWLETALADAGLRPDAADAAGDLQVHVQKNGAEYFVDGRVHAGLLTDCVRCLGSAKVPVDTRFATLFTRAAGADGGRGGRAEHTEVDETFDADDEDELSREEFCGHEIVLDDLIREYLVLEAPMQPLCSPDCQGIAVPRHVRPPEEVFGTSDGKVDPRLAPLLRLRDKVPPNKE